MWSSKKRVPFLSLGVFIHTSDLTVSYLSGVLPGWAIPSRGNTQQTAPPPSRLFPPQIQPDGVTLEYNPYSWNLVLPPFWVLGGCLGSWMGKGTAPLSPFPLPL